MKLTDALQTEIWSKQVTRRIWMVVCTALALTVLWYEFNRHWLTPQERKSARVALAKIDVFEFSDGVNVVKLNTQIEDATEAVRAAKHTTWTTRDKATAELLSMYLDLAKVEKSERAQPLAMRYAQQQELLESARMSKTVCTVLSHELHALLDD